MSLLCLYHFQCIRFASCHLRRKQGLSRDNHSSPASHIASPLSTGGLLQSTQCYTHQPSCITLPSVTPTPKFVPPHQAVICCLLHLSFILLFLKLNYTVSKNAAGAATITLPCLLRLHSAYCSAPIITLSPQKIPTVASTSLVMLLQL